MHNFELRDADMGVDGGGFKALVNEELLDEAYIYTALEHVDGAAVAE